MTCCSATSPGPKLADQLELGQAAALVLTMDDPVLVARIARRVRGWMPDLPIIARARDTDHAAELYKAGVTDAVPETLEASLQLSEAVLVDLGVAMGPVIAVDPRETRRAPRGNHGRKPSSSPNRAWAGEGCATARLAAHRHAKAGVALDPDGLTWRQRYGLGQLHLARALAVTCQQLAWALPANGNVN